VVCVTGRAFVALSLALFALLSGCASYSDKTLPIRNALDAGTPKVALGLINEKLDVKNESQLPEDVGGDNALTILDRGMVLQCLGQHKLSSRDLESSDKKIEMLDLSRNAVHEIGKYLFSDDVGPYKAPPYEKLMINTMNMVNYLVRGDLQGARVEARRLAVMQKYLAESEGKSKSLIGLGSYLAGFTFEKSGKPDEALRYYDEALAYADYASLEEPIRRLSATTPYDTPRIRKVLERAQTTTPLGPEEAEILIVIGYSRVPPKIAKRIPIGLALTYASAFMSPANSELANRYAAQGLVTWINFPDLPPPSKQPPADPRWLLDNQATRLEGTLNVELEARRAWEDARGPVVASAITRMIARIVAGEAIRRSAKDDGVGLLLSLGAQATMVAADTPDTRSWETLPARIAIGRVRVPAGTHKSRVQTGRATGQQSVVLKPGGWVALSLMSLASG